MARCPKCGAEIIPEGAWTCVACGANVRKIQSVEKPVKKVVKRSVPKPKFAPMRAEEFFA